MIIQLLTLLLVLIGSLHITILIVLAIKCFDAPWVKLVLVRSRKLNNFLTIYENSFGVITAVIIIEALLLFTYKWISQ